jgi:Xaa-Pro aminopeptidase
MRHKPIKSSLFTANRKRLGELLPERTLAIINANDVPPTNSDGTLVMWPNSDLFYLSGIEQEESILLLFPGAVDERHREILFVRQPSERLKLWEGHKHDAEEARSISGVKEVRWLSEFPEILRMLVCEAEGICLNANEHRRAVVDVESRDLRFARDCMRRYPLHRYHRLAPLMHRLRPVKSEAEVELIKEACRITRLGFLRALKQTKPGLNECDIEAEFAHEFILNRAKFAYSPIIASGANACVLHYLENDKPLRARDLLLLDVGANYGNYAADMTRTIPINGRFSRRQKQVYKAVLRVMRAMITAATPGKSPKLWQQESEEMMTDELLELGLLKPAEVRKSKPRHLACKKYFPHGLGHPLGLDVHDVAPADAVFQEGWVLTVEPGIYLPEEGFAVRLENNIVVTETGPVDLMADIPVEPEEIEALMRR